MSTVRFLCLLKVYYPNFYDNNMYTPEINDYNQYLSGGHTKWSTAFWDWFSNTYLLKDVYPLKYYPSGSYY